MCFPIPEPPEIQSGFRAVRVTPTPNLTISAAVVAAGTPVQVIYPTEQYDLRYEYDTITIPPIPPGTLDSSFIPKSKGIYSIIASVEFDPDGDTTVVSSLSLSIVITTTIGGTIVITDNDSIPAGGNNIVSVSTNIQLNAGDIVRVFVTTSVPGVIVSNPAATHFQATRFPSPTM